MKRTKKALPLLLALGLCLSLFPTTAFATDGDFTIEDGILTEYNGNGGNVTIPDDVTIIGEGAFLGCDNLTNVNLGGVTVIEENAFRFCTGLTSITIPGGVTTIEDFAFFGCDNLTSITIPNNVTYIAWSAFTTHIDSPEYVPISGLTIYGVAGSVAENYAKETGIPFVSVGITTPVENIGSFSDVTPDAYYADAVAWAVSKGITAGTSNTTFSPNSTCTQAQIITFLYRAVGEPAITEENSYTNSSIISGKYYYNAMLWAYQNSVVTNIDLDPNSDCTRSDVVTYLWRLAGAPAVSNCNFTDVPASASYAQAVAWALQQNITAGTSNTTFSPNNTCTRGQIVTFLHRAYAG